MGTEILNSRDTSKTGFITTSYGDDSIVAGKTGVVVSSMNLSSEQTVNFLIDMSSVDVDKTVFIFPCLISSSDTRVEFRFYEGTDYSGGTTVTPFNPNRTSEQTLQTVLTSGATGTDKGDLLPTRNAFANHKDSANSLIYPFLILDKNKKYIAEFENKEAQSTVIDYSTSIFEV